MKERLLVRNASGTDKKVIEVEYVRASYYSHDTDYVPEHRGVSLKAYDVLVNGKKAGRIQQVVSHSSATYRGTMIRRATRGTVMWGWDAGTKSNSPGVYARNRRGAVADLLGYDRYLVGVVT